VELGGLVNLGPVYLVLYLFDLFWDAH
jgi:hypothetical protein